MTITTGETTVAVARLATPLGDMHLFGTSNGLLAITLPGQPREDGEALVRRWLGPVTFSEQPGALAGALTQLAEYFAGQRREFDVPLDLRGTPFQQRVWRAVLAVPYGKSSTYGQIAAAIGKPAAARAVGAANGANPLPPIVPCHRLIGASGALHGYGGGLATKARLLALERGVPNWLTWDTWERKSPQSTQRPQSETNNTA
ncbi:MAG: methylated-DNA--[protein]-cysteine S-methyltransferase [Thermomicrobiales bacterium]